MTEANREAEARLTVQVQGIPCRIGAHPHAGPHLSTRAAVDEFWRLRDLQRSKP